jgi:hypothetical protein
VAYRYIQRSPFPRPAQTSSTMPTPHIRTLKRALEIVETKARLAIALDVTPQDLDEYLAGKKPVPTDKFIETLDIVAHGKT